MVQKIEKDGIFPNSFYKASITLTAKSTKDTFEKSYTKQQQSKSNHPLKEQHAPNSNLIQKYFKVMKHYYNPWHQ